MFRASKQEASKIATRCVWFIKYRGSGSGVSEWTGSCNSCRSTIRWLQICWTNTRYSEQLFDTYAESALKLAARRIFPSNPDVNDPRWTNSDTFARLNRSAPTIFKRDDMKLSILENRTCGIRGILIPAQFKNN